MPRNRALKKANKRHAKRQEWLKGVPGFLGGGSWSPGTGSYANAAAAANSHPPPPPPPNPTHDEIEGGFLVTYETDEDGNDHVVGMLDLSPPTGGSGSGGSDHYSTDLNAAIERARMQQQQEQWQAEYALAQGDNVEVNRHNQQAEMFDSLALQLQQAKETHDYQMAQANLALQTTQLGQGQQQINATNSQNQFGNQMDLANYGLNAYTAQTNNTVAQGNLGLGYANLGLNAYQTQSDVAIAQQSHQMEMWRAQLDAQIAQKNYEIQSYATQVQAATAMGQLGVAQDAEARMRAAQQEAAVLDQYNAQLEAHQQQLTAQSQGAGQIGDLATNMGAQQNDRARFLSQLAANPRDFAQLQYALGNGTNFVNQLLSGQGIPGQSTAQIGGIPTLGAGFDQLAAAVTARPDIPLYQEALKQSMNLINLGSQTPTPPSLAQLQQYLQLAPMHESPTMPTAPTNTALNIPPMPVFDPLPTYTAPTMPELHFPDAPPPPAPYVAPTAAQQMLDPSQQDIYNRFTTAAPSVDASTAIGIAQRPADAIAYMNAAARPAAPPHAPRPVTNNPAVDQWNPQQLAYIQAVAAAQGAAPHAQGGMVRPTPRAQATPQNPHFERGGNSRNFPAARGDRFMGPHGWYQNTVPMPARKSFNEFVKYVMQHDHREHRYIGDERKDLRHFYDMVSVQRAAQGGPVIGNHPAVLMDMQTGKPLATMFEPTKKYPGGIPEVLTPLPNYPNGVKVTPVDKLKKRNATGGTLPSEDTYLGTGFTKQNNPPLSITPPPPNPLVTSATTASPPPTPGQTAYNTKYGNGVPGNPNFDPSKLPSEDTYMGPGFTNYNATAPTPPVLPPPSPAHQGGGGNGSPPGAPVLPSYTPPPPPPPTYGNDYIQNLINGLNPPQAQPHNGPTPIYSPGEVIRRFMGGLDPRTYNRKLLPSQRDFLASAVSALGVPPEDFWASVERMYPRGVDPSQIFFGSNI